MPTHKTRKGSLQFYPRKRIDKFIPSVNWAPVKTGEKGLLGFIAYKAGMASAIVKDTTEHSMTKGKRIIVPVSVLEVPSMKIYSVRFYKSGKVIKDVVVSNDKELRKKLKISKTQKNLENEIPKEFDDIRLLVYSVVKQTRIKKTPDLAEIAMNHDNKLDFVKSLVGKEISISDFVKTNLVDVRG